MPRRSLYKTAPPSLVSVVNLLTAHPTQARVLIAAELEHRQDTLLLLRQARSFVVSRMWDALQSFLVMSVLILSLLWTFRGIALTREWFHALDARLIPGGASFYQQFKLLIAASPLGTWPWEIPAAMIVVLVLGVYARHLAVLLFSWRELQALHLATQKKQTEVDFLERWQHHIHRTKKN